MTIHRSGDNLPAVVDSTSSFTLLPSAMTLARQVAGTDFVPKALRGKPEQVLACILTGHELGVGPMMALSKIHVIEGRPAMAAELMRAVILREGHDLWIEEHSNTRCTIGTRRNGSVRDQTFTFTLDDAKQAGIAGKQVWRQYPRAMLLARATGEMARALYADILAGISYTTEELTDGDEVDDVDAPPPASNGRAGKRTAKASKPATRAAAQPKPAPVATDLPPLPGEDEYDDVTAGPRMSGAQMVAMKFGDRDITDRDERLQITSTIVGRGVTSSKDLTPDEISKVLEVLGDDDAFDKVGYAETVGDDERQADDETEDQTRLRLKRPSDTAGWRELLKQHGKRVVDALKVTGTPSLDNLDDEAADALLLWLTRES